MAKKSTQSKPIVERDYLDGTINKIVTKKSTQSKEFVEGDLEYGAIKRVDRKVVVVRKKEQG